MTLITPKIIAKQDSKPSHPIKDFVSITPDNPIAQKYHLHALTEDDLVFTDEICDDRTNSTLHLSDYDWMSYHYDTRFSTRSIGTLVIRFEYVGATFSNMFVKQFLPNNLTHAKEDYLVQHSFDFSSRLFDDYLVKDLTARCDKILYDTYAYNTEMLLVDWYNEVLATGQKSDSEYFPSEPFDWEWIPT